MKLNKLWATAFLTLALVSCKNESAREPQLQENMKFPVALSLEGSKSGALRADYQSSSLSASAANERAIENLTVVVFTNDGANNTPVAVEKVITYDKLDKTSGSDPYQGEYKFDMGMAGTFHMEVIANGYKDDSDKEDFIKKFKQGLSYEQFKELLFERELPSHGETGFAMLSTEPVKVATEEGVPCHAGTIKLRRLACRFDVFNKLTEEDLKLTKVTLQNQITKSYLLPQSEVPAGADGGAKEYTANGDWFNDYLVTQGIYSYENPKRGATRLILEGTYKGEAWQKVIVFKKDGRFIDTQRNHIYRVHLTKGNGTTPGGGDNGGGKDDPANADKINYVIEVLDWDEDASLDYTDDDIWQAEKRINPLAYVAEYNINPEGTGFVTDLYATNVSGYFDFDTAVAKFSSFEQDGVKYHLPSEDESKAIIPCDARTLNADNITRVPFSFPVDALNLSENVVIAKKSIVCLQDFKGSGNSVCYALRFKGTKYQSAWKYECVKEGEFQVMRITTRNVTDGVTIAKVATPEFWQQNNTADVVRIFPASGYKVKAADPAPNSEGFAAFFWTSTPVPTGSASYFGFMGGDTNSSAYIADFHKIRTYGLTIRLFKDTLE